MHGIKLAGLLMMLLASQITLGYQHGRNVEETYLYPDYAWHSPAMGRAR